MIPENAIAHNNRKRRRKNYRIRVDRYAVYRQKCESATNIPDQRADRKIKNVLFPISLCASICLIQKNVGIDHCPGEKDYERSVYRGWRKVIQIAEHQVHTMDKPAGKRIQH